MNTPAVNFLYNASSSNTTFQELMKSFPIQVFKKDDYLSKEGQEPIVIFYIQSGQVLSVKNYQAKKKELALGFYQAGQFVNLTSLLANHKNSYSTKAINKVVTRIIPIFEFHMIMRKNPYINQMIFNALANELEQKKERYYKNVTLDSRQRIITFLVDQVKYIGTRVGYEWVIRDFLTQMEIAQLTNTARQTVNVTMNNLRRKKLIYFKYKYFIVRELQVLEELANQKSAI